MDLSYAREMVRVAALAVGKEEMSFFTNTKVPLRYRSHLDPKSGEKFPDANDVMKWCLGDEPEGSTQSMLFEEDWTEDAHQCTSLYGLCE